MKRKQLDKALRRTISLLRESARQVRRESRPGYRRYAVYCYLRDVYSEYADLRSRRIAKASTRQIARFLGLTRQYRSHPIRVLIEATAGPEDAKQKSRWTQALRYALGWRQPATRLRWFFRVNGGISGCARSQAVLNKASAQRRSISSPSRVFRNR